MEALTGYHTATLNRTSQVDQAYDLIAHKLKDVNNTLTKRALV